MMNFPDTMFGTRLIGCGQCGKEVVKWEGFFILITVLERYGICVSYLQRFVVQLLMNPCELSLELFVELLKKHVRNMDSWMTITNGMRCYKNVQSRVSQVKSESTLFTLSSIVKLVILVAYGQSTGKL